MTEPGRPLARPTDLPKLRAQTIRTVQSTENGHALLLPGDDDLVHLVCTGLAAADLYWASADMTALAMAAGAQLTEARWATADRPTPIGLVVFDGGVGRVDFGPGMADAVDAISWHPAPDGDLMLIHYTARARLQLHLQLPHEQVGKLPPLLPIREVRVPVTTEPVPFTDVPPREGMPVPVPIVAALAASWHLMQQPQLVSRAREEPRPKAARALRRAGHPASGVTLVDLRRQYTPQDRDPDAGSDGRTYRHRWVVSGHWRQQPYGPGREQRRQQWIPAHVKGPDGAPLLAAERVNVWRR